MISVNKKAKLSSLNVKAADNITVNADGSATVVMEYSAKTLNVNNSGSLTLPSTVNAKRLPSLLTTVPNYPFPAKPTI